MKFIFVSSSFNIGGVATSFSYLVDEVIDKNAEVEFHIVDQIADIKAYIPERVKIRHVHGYYNDIYGSGTKTGIKFLYEKFGIWPAIKLIYVWMLKKIRIYKPFILSKEFFDEAPKYKCDVCVILKENDICLFYAINYVDSKKRIAFFHTAGYLEEKYKPIYCSKLIDEIITVSEGNRDFLVENMPSVKQKIHVIHNVVPVRRIRTMAIKKDTLFAAGEFSIIYVGRICNEKGLDVIIKAAMLLKEEIPNIHWYLLGRFDKGLSIDDFEETLKTNDIYIQISVLEPTDNPYPFIAQAQVIVNPSYIESFGMVIREAQILGKPVVATKTYGGVELIEDGRTGLLTEVGNPNQLADAVKRLYFDSNLYQNIVKNLKMENFDETEQVREQFNSLVRQHNS